MPSSPPSFLVQPQPCPFWYGVMIPVQTASVFWEWQVRHLLPWWYLIVLTQMWGCHGNCICSSWEVVKASSFFLSAEKGSKAPSRLLLAALQWLSFQGCFIMHRLRISSFDLHRRRNRFVSWRHKCFPTYQTRHRHFCCKLVSLQFPRLIFTADRISLSLPSFF